MGLLNRLVLRFLSVPNQRRWKSFTSQWRARIGFWGFFIVIFFSMTAELWSNQKPLLLIREKFATTTIADGTSKTAGMGSEKWFFPAFFEYPVSEFGIEDAFTVDYNELVDNDRLAGKKPTVIFPFNRWDPYIQTPDVMIGPTTWHWMGTDSLGRDVTARLLYGIRVSMVFGLCFWFMSFVIGIFVGSIQGFRGGTFDFATERFKELFEIVPFLSVVILINGLMKSQSIWVTLMIVVAFFWISIASQMRAQFLSLRRRDFCEAAKALGASNIRIIFQHILPNALTPVLTLTPFTISSGIAFLAVLDFLGFGLNPPTPSLGELLQQGRSYITNAPWLLLAPTGALIVMLLSINLIGEALRQAFDPKKT